MATTYRTAAAATAAAEGAITTREPGTPHEWEIGDRVQGGEIPADHDTGRVIAIDGDRITVGWDSGVITTVDADDIWEED